MILATEVLPFETAPELEPSARKRKASDALGQVAEPPKAYKRPTYKGKAIRLQKQGDADDVGND